MKRLIAMVAVLAVLTAACAESGAQPIGPAPSDEPSSPSSPTGSPTSPSPSPIPARVMTYELWFNYDGSLFVSHRTEEFVPGVGARSIERLLEGPTNAESDAGLHSEIQPGTRLLDLTIDDGVATVNLDRAFIIAGDAGDRGRQPLADRLHAHAVRLGRRRSVRGRRDAAHELRRLRDRRPPAPRELRRPAAVHPGPEPADQGARLEPRAHQRDGGRVRGGRLHRDPRPGREGDRVHVHDGHLRHRLPGNVGDRRRVRRRREPARHDPRVRGQRDGRLGDPRGGHPGHAHRVIRDPGEGGLAAALSRGPIPCRSPGRRRRCDAPPRAVARRRIPRQVRGTPRLGDGSVSEVHARVVPVDAASLPPPVGTSSPPRVGACFPASVRRNLVDHGGRVILAFVA